MARVFYTTENLISEVRGLLSETNTDAVSDSVDILPALNRAQEYAFDIYARKYPEPILKYASVTPTAGNAEFAIPEDAFEDRLVKVEVVIPGSGSLASYIQVQRLNFRDVSEFESTATTSTPTYYTVVGRNVRLLPAPSATYNLRIWYLREPTRLVQVGGRITSINSGSNYINVDSVGEDLSSDSTEKGSYVNFVDGQTGEVKSTQQIQSISGTRVNFRSTPVQATLFNQVVSGSLDSDVELDDYVCIATGTCVPFYGSPTGNFLIQFAVAEITRKLGGQAQLEEQILQKFESQVEKTWAGREAQMRIRKNNLIWGTSAVSRRIYPTSN